MATILGVSEIDGIERALVVVAHPDDCDFGNAGTTAKWTDAGVTVSYCIITDGDAGGSDRSISRKEMAAIRRVEQTEAAAAVGVTDLTFLGYPDGRLTPSIELRRDITRVIRVKQPQRVITQSPLRNFTRIFASHPDHLAAGEAALCAVYPDSRNPFAHPELLEVEGLEPYSVAEVWLSAVAGGSPEVKVVDVTDTADRKLAALRCHRSQYTDWDALEERVRGWLEATAKANGLEPGALQSSSSSFPPHDPARQGRRRNVGRLAVPDHGAARGGRADAAHDVQLSGGDAYWIEGRPLEHGRCVIVREHDGVISDVIDAPVLGSYLGARVRRRGDAGARRYRVLLQCR